MTETKKTLLSLQEQFCRGVRQGKFDDPSIFAEDVKGTCYQTGSGQGAEAMNRLFAYEGPKAEWVKQNVENVITHWRDGRAQQSFHLHQLYALTSANGEFHYFQYGGTFVLSYGKREEGWKITEVLFDLCWTDGNTYWVKDWKMIDFRMPKQHKKVISWERDGVCRVIPKTEEPQTDEDKLQELMFLYGWVIDAEDYELFQEIAMPDVQVEDGYHGRVFEGNSVWTDFLKTLNEKEPCLHHTYQIGYIQVKGNRAVGTMFRLEPNRIGSKTINRETFLLDWLTLDYQVEFKMLDTGWKISRVQFRKNIRGVAAYE